MNNQSNRLPRPAKSLMLLLFFFLAVIPNLPAQGDQTSFDHRELNNGMEIFMISDERVPLVTIRLTIRCGALSQDRETAGLFHLYEHMLFKGNRTYPDQSAFKATLKELGVGSWNGGTSTEYVTYYFTLPSSRLEEGLRFWAEALRYPLLQEEELNPEKEVVINEIRGYHNDRSHIYASALSRTLFFQYPWRRDVAGPERNISASTIEDMKAIQNQYYKPDKTALFLSGDFNTSRAMRVIKEIWGNWEAANTPDTTPPPHPPLRENSRLYFEDPQFYPGITQVSITLRGPDVDKDPEATYAADLLLMLLDNPESPFRESLYAQVPGLYSKEYIWASYLTQRDGGEISFGAYLTAHEEQTSFARALLFREKLYEELEKMAADPDYFDLREFELVKQRLADQQLLERDNPAALASALSF